MRAVQTAIAALICVLCAPAVAAAVIPLLQDIAARRRLTHESAPHRVTAGEGKGTERTPMTQITSVPFHGTNILTDEDGTHVLLRPIAEALCLDADFLAGAR